MKMKWNFRHMILLVLLAVGVPLVLAASLSQEKDDNHTGVMPATGTPASQGGALPTSTGDEATATQEQFSPTETSPPATVEVEAEVCDWSITFEDDFEGDTLDTSKWDTGYKAGDHEAQYYVDDAFDLVDGLLVIRAEEKQIKDREYASGILTTQGIFDQRYGRFEVRAKAPAGKGLWPAFWLLPSKENYPWEIDVFEVLGHKPNSVYMSHHWPDEDGDHVFETRSYKGPDLTQDFHTFEIIWSPDQIIWLVDGVERSRQNENIPDDSMFLLLNLAVGGKWPGYPDSSTPFPSHLEVDFVRVYEWSCPNGVGQ
jgi:beta-glucanase (GH16 family)